VGLQAVGVAVVLVVQLLAAVVVAPQEVWMVAVSLEGEWLKDWIT